MLEIGINKNVLIMHGERIEITKEMVHWLYDNTRIPVRFNLTMED